MRALGRFRTSRIGPGLPTAALAAAALFWIAYDNGSYALESWSVIAIVFLWAIALALVFGLTAREPAPTASLVVGGLIAALALWTFSSLLWSTDAESTFEEFNRVALYLATFALVVLVSSRRTIDRWADGMAVAIVAVAGVALVSRLFPGSFPGRDLPTFLPRDVTRLSFPLGYWNGLAIFVALGVPLLLRIALVARKPAWRGLSLAALPVIASVIYLASSRGGVVTVVIGSAVFVALTERRWVAAAALATSLLGSAAAVAVLLQRDELVNGPLGTALVEHQGRSAAVLIAFISAATGVLYGIGCVVLRGRIHPSAAFGWTLVLALLVATAVGVAASHPRDRFETFTKLPTDLQAIHRGDFVQAHLLSGGGSGRWQFWSVAADEWRKHPLLGGGAGSYESWWAAHASFSYFVRDAHSLYLETLGELGVVGFALVIALAATGIAVGVLRARGATGDLRVTAAALSAVFTAYAAVAGFDWVWELTAVSVVAFVALALVCGLGTVPPERLRVASPGERPKGTYRRFGVGLAALLAVWLLLFAQAIPLLAELEIGKSQAAVDRGDLHAALSAAEAARDIQPWASSPYLQLSLVSEQAGDLRLARQRIRQAIERDERDWRLWLVAARLETKLGNVAAGERDLRHAAALNPRSPLFKGIIQQ